MHDKSSKIIILMQELHLSTIEQLQKYNEILVLLKNEICSISIMLVFFGFMRTKKKCQRLNQRLLIK